MTTYARHRFLLLGCIVLALACSAAQETPTPSGNGDDDGTTDHPSSPPAAPQETLPPPKILDSNAISVDAIMPPHPTDREDEYLCTAVELPDRPMKLIGVEPLADMATVHHMLLFGTYIICYYFHTHTIISH